MKTRLTNLLSLLLMLTMSVSAWAEARTYCGYYGDETKQDGKYCSINWQTNVAGDVVITLSDGPSDGTGYTGVSFRDDCFEGSFDLFKVISSNGEENASVYFTRERSAADNYYILRKNATPLPAGDITIKSTATLAWKSTESDSRYKMNPTFEYIYGTHCQSVATPTNVAVSATGYVTFDNVAGANGYYARIYDEETLVNTQEITNGGLLQFITTKTSYTVKIVAAKDGFGSEESVPATWTTYAHHVFGVSDMQAYTENQFKSGTTQVGLTFTTDANGNVIIKVVPVNGTESAHFREQGIGGSSLQSFDIIYGADFSQSTPASTYFTRPSGNVTGDVIVLTKKEGVQLPYPCKLQYNGTNAFVWTAINGGETKNEYCTPAHFTYTYGTTCRVNEGMPGNVSVSTMGRVKHDNVAGAVKYTAVVLKDGAIVLQQDITSGAPLNWIPIVGGTYKVTVIAFDAEGNMFDVPAETDWTVEAGHVYGATNVFAYKFVSGDNNCKNIPAYFTYETRADGAIVLTITDNAEGIVNGNATFRATSLSLTKFTLNGSADDMAAKFEKTYVNDSKVPYYILTLKDGQDAPAAGSTIDFNGQVTYVCGAANDAWPTIKLPTYIYGTPRYPKEATAPVITSFTGESNDYTTATLNVVASDKDDDEIDQPVLTYTLSGDNDFVTTEVTPVAGVIELTDLKKNKIYHFTLTVTDPSGNSASENVEVKMLFDTNDNLALKKPTQASYTQGGGADGSYKAVDGDESTAWTSFDNASRNEWWKVDLGLEYSINKIHITFNDHQGTYQILYSKDEEDWHIYADDFTVGAEKVVEFTTVASARYLKFTTTHTNVGLFEFVVNGNGYASADEVAPTIDILEVAATTTNSVTLHIEASDKDDAGNPGTITSIKVSDVANGLAEREVISEMNENKVTLTGLKDNTVYTFHVVVADAAGNTTSKDIEARVTFNTEANLALASNGATVVAGAEEGANTADKAIDGKDNTYWGTYKDGGRDNWEEANTLTLTLAASYNINKIVIMNGGTQGAGQILRLEYLTKDESWVVFENNIAATDNSTIELPVVISAQKLRLTGTKNNMIAIKEFEVYGSGYDDPDTEKPVITAAALVGAAGEDEATISVTATDNVGVYACRFTDGSFTQTADLVAGQCHVTGLVPGTTYTFSVVALDRAGNESEPFVMAPFRTVGNDAVPHTAAPAPKQNAIDVFSLYSDTYTNAVKSFNWQNWNAATTCKELEIMGNSYRIYSAANHGEVGIGSHFKAVDSDVNDIDVSAWKFLHVDVWTDKAFTIGVTMNDTRVGTFALTAGEWTSIDMDVTGVSTDIRTALAHMKFTEITNHTFAVDNIFFWNDLDVTITDNGNNDQVMSEFNNRYVNVTLNRGFTAGTLYTLCLPFSMDEAQVENVFGAGTEVWYLTGSEDRGSLIHIDFALQSHIEAGIPYLFKPAENFVSGTAINNVTLRNTEGETVVTSLFTMKGYVNPTDFTVADGYYFLAADKYLHTLGAAVTSPGLRSAFTISEGVDPAAARKPARVVLGTEVTTDMPAINAEVGLEKIMRDGQLYIIREGKMYNVQGQLVK